MPGTIYDGVTLSGWTGQEGDIYTNCTFNGPATFMEGSLFDGCQLLGTGANPIHTGKGNVFGNTIAPCTFSHVVFGEENILHEGWVDSGDNTRGTDGNYGEPPVDGLKKGILKTNQMCSTDSGSDTGSGADDGLEKLPICVQGEKKTWQKDVLTGDRKDGLDSGSSP